MCLSIIAQIPKESKKRVGAKRLSNLTGLHVIKTKFRGETALHFSVSGGCSCGFLCKSYDSEAPTWSLNPEHLSKLNKAISIIDEEADSFLFLAHFIGGELPEKEIETTFHELNSDIENNRIKNNTLYLIKKIS
jgi:hypothetical protein